MPHIQFTTTEIDRFLHIIRSHDAAAALRDALTTDHRGRKGEFTTEHFLLGMFMSLAAHNTITSRKIRALLNDALPESMRPELGLTFRVKSHVDTMTKRITDKLGHVDTTPDERQDRQRRLNTVIDALVDGSLVTHDHGGWYALDGTGLDTRGRPKPNSDDTDVRASAEVIETATDRLTSRPTKSGKRRQRNCDAEAAWGHKTSKNGGRMPIYGYMIDAMVAIPNGKTRPPQVAVRIRVSPANVDVVAPSLELIDGVRAKDIAATDIVGDRHYSNKLESRWAAALRERNVTQHLDLMQHDQGFKQHDQMRLTGGWLHCPGTPDELAVIPRPAFNATSDDLSRFADLIARRWSYALERKERTDSNGRSRWVCPALAGKAGCPLRPGSEAIATQKGLPIITNHPAPETAPACCTQNSIAVKNTGVAKLEQRHYWGTPAWFEAYNRRTYVEGYFGSLKNPQTENLSRGITEWMGLALRSLVIAVAFAATNLRHQRSHEPYSGIDHPLLTPDPQQPRKVEMTEAQLEEYRAFLVSRAPREETVGVMAVGQLHDPRGEAPTTTTKEPPRIAS